MTIKPYLLALLIIFIAFPVFAQKASIGGHVKSASTGETLPSATIYETTSGDGTVTNSNGFFSLALKPSIVSVKISFMGYETLETSFKLSHDTLIDFMLSDKTILSDEINVYAKQPIHEQTLMGRTLVSSGQINAVPNFTGQPDLLKSITTIPGISGGREGYSNITVRGGDRGQNLILLDGVKLYNTNHLGGLISLFNSDIIKQAEVYKGGFPSRYGDRLSSVIDISTIDGNRQTIKGKFSLGLLSSSISVNGPIGEKISYSLAARSSYIDLFQIGAKRKLEKQNKGFYQGYTFYDLNTKITYYHTPLDKWIISAYSGMDHNRSITKSNNNNAFDTYERYSTKISNRFISLSNQRTLTNKIYIKNSLNISGYSNLFSIYSLQTGLGDSVLSTQLLRSNIGEINLQSRAEYFHSPKHSLRAGLEYSNYNFLPGVDIKTLHNNNAGIQLDTAIGYTSHINANQYTAYFEDEMKLGTNSQLNLGIRTVMFTCNKKNYFRTEPRVSLRTMLSPNISAKINYTRMHQFNHLLVSNLMGFEREIWLTSNEEIPPQLSDQISVGFFYSSPNKKLSLSAEGYYKSMNNLLEFHFAADGEIILSDLNKMVYKNGEGEAYGAEFQAIYQTKNISTTLNYVLSWNNRKFEQLNNGQKYPFLYDRRHNINLFNQFILNKKFTINTNFTYSTGTPISLPEAYVSQDFYSYRYYIYTSINNKKLPDYHRLDLSLVKNTLTKRGREQQFTISVYNAYARQNAAYIYFKNNKIYQKSQFTIIPTVSYSLNF